MSKESIDLLEERYKIAINFSDTYVCLPVLDAKRILDFLKQQLTAGDFTKKVRSSVQSKGSIIAKITDIKILAIIGWIPQLCDRLDRAESINTDLADNLKMLVSLLCHPGSFVSAEDIEKAKAAIAKAIPQS